MSLRTQRSKISALAPSRRSWHGLSALKSQQPYWQRIPRWQDVSKDEFLSYNWQVSFQSKKKKQRRQKNR